MEKIRNYILSKKLVTRQEIMDRFMISKTTADNAINSLRSEGRVRGYVKDRKQYFRTNHRPNLTSGHQSLGKEMLLQMPDLDAIRSRFKTNSQGE